MPFVLSMPSLLGKKILLTKILLILVTILWCSLTFAHGDIHHRIDNLTFKLTQTPDDSKLFIERGRLYLDTHHAQEATADFKKALQLKPQDSGSYFYLAQANLIANKKSEALAALDKFMQNQYQDAPLARGFALRGDIYEASGNHAEAALAYTESLHYKKAAALPDDYIRLADTYLAANVNNSAQALAVLDQGIQQLGDLQALELRAMNIELQANQPGAAIERINRILVKTPTPYLLLEKGKILKNMGDVQQANATFTAALNAIAQLPAARNNTRAIQSLRNEIALQMNTAAKN